MHQDNATVFVQVSVGRFPPPGSLARSSQNLIILTGPQQYKRLIKSPAVFKCAARSGANEQSRFYPLLLSE